jgi:hypothetical protein
MKTNNYTDNSNSIIRLECVIVNQLDEAVKAKVAGMVSRWRVVGEAFSPAAGIHCGDRVQCSLVA